MSKVHVELGERSYDIIIRKGLLDTMDLKLTPGRKCLVVADLNVGGLYLEKVCRRLAELGGDVCNCVINPGEHYKNLTTIAEICRVAAQMGLDRKSLIVGLGGGVTGDMAGFAAAVYMRGIGFMQVPTSLLAMVDSSVGGKTGVDLPEGKNLVGAFHQPETVMIDPDALKTLPKSEIRNGLAEVIKYGVIMDCGFFGILEENKCKVSGEIIAHCCHLKATVVSEDEKESGRRAILNYGHTFGHAVEKLSEYQMSHGEAVAIGMAMAGSMATQNQLWHPDDEKRQNDLMLVAGLPFRVSGYRPEDILEAMKSDKKKSNGRLTLVLPVKIGKVELFREFDDAKILAAIRSCCD